MQSYLYLSLDIASILVPLLFSFHPKAHFGSRWRAWLPALMIPALMFIAWDSWFTGMSVWGFNPRYLTGVWLGNLPIEEVLFFFCIPYSCLFTYAAVNYLRKSEPLPDNGRRVTWILILGLSACGLRYHYLWYPFVTFLALAVFLLILVVWVKPFFMGRFYFSYLIILIPFFIVNGMLTGTGLDEPVVWYNDAENLGIRITTIPIEDTFYGMLLILMNVTIYEFRLHKQQNL